MPYRIVQTRVPLFMQYRGQEVFRVYRYGDVNSGVFRGYTYTFDPVEGSDDEIDGVVTFDVRDLSTWREPRHPPFLIGEGNTQKNREAWKRYMDDKMEEKAIRTAIRTALDGGEITSGAASRIKGRRSAA